MVEFDVVSAPAYAADIASVSHDTTLRLAPGARGPRFRPSPSGHDPTQQQTEVRCGRDRAQRRHSARQNFSTGPSALSTVRLQDEREPTTAFGGVGSRFDARQNADGGPGRSLRSLATPLGATRFTRSDVGIMPSSAPCKRAPAIMVGAPARVTY